MPKKLSRTITKKAGEHATNLKRFARKNQFFIRFNLPAIFLSFLRFF
jgi:hypothetical protein